MQSIALTARVDTDGILRLQVPMDVVNTDVEVVVVFSPLDGSANEMTLPSTTSEEALGWPPKYFEPIYGILRDDPIERPPQGEFDVCEAAAATE